MDLPRFTLKANSIEVLHRPAEFYAQLIQSIRSAKRRIFLSSLYIGKEELELVGELHTALKASEGLNVHILLDALRATREHPKSASSVSLVASLQAAFPRRVKVSLYHSPELHGLLKAVVPKRFDEGWGLWHAKMYGFDDDLIISGANLSADYFNQRQDRYMIFRSASALTDYFAALVALSSAFCYGLIGRDASSTLAAFDLTWPHADLERPEKKHRAFRETVSQRLNEFTTNFAQFLSPRETPGDDTTISPVLQMGSFGIHQETDTVMPALFECAHALDPAIASLSFTSGYFNMTPQMTRQLLACPIPSSVVCASPQANGFYGSQGFSRHIPAGYTEAEKRFYLQAHSSAAAQVTLSEYARQGWTYHAKGLWLHTDNVGPGTTYIGSSNYGPRSARRDVEANLLITTKSDEFKGRLKDEIKQIETYTQPVDAQTFEAPDRKVTMGVSIAARLIKDML